MSSPARRSGNRPTRRQREARAYRLVMTTGTLGALTVAAAIIWLIPVVDFVGFGTTLLLAILTAVAGVLTSRSLGRR